METKLLSFSPSKSKYILESSSTKNGDWKDRYSKLYSTHHSMFRIQEDEARRISFMGNDATPYTSLLMRMRATRQDSLVYGCNVGTQFDVNTILSQRSELYDSIFHSRSDDLGGNDTLLLDMVRARSRELEEEAQDKTVDLPRGDVSDDQSSEACVHGLSMRTTERSVSRSRVSRISNRRDMDIPSILAFEIPVTPGPAPLGVPELQKVNQPTKEDIPRWSIRRSICPVCSQKWRDKSSIRNVKYSGLKRNYTADLPSVIAPARLRASITKDYVPRPFPATVDESKRIGRAMRNSGAAWQLTRARRFRIPKLQMPSPEAIAPLSSTAPMARKDLDSRVSRFLKDERMTKTLTS